MKLVEMAVVREAMGDRVAKQEAVEVEVGMRGVRVAAAAGEGSIFANQCLLKSYQISRIRCRRLG